MAASCLTWGLSRTLEPTLLDSLPKQHRAANGVEEETSPSEETIADAGTTEVEGLLLLAYHGH